MFKNFTMWEAIKVGGPVMFVLIACSVLSIAIIIERYFYYNLRSRVARAFFLKRLRESVEQGDLKKALTVCENTLSPSSAVALAGLNGAHLEDKDISEAMERQVIIEINGLEKRTAIVGTIGSTAVYIGLLGTVLGIIDTFREIAQVGSGGINVVIRGISEALVCTAAGLCVAIPAIMAYNYFVKRISGFVTDMELTSSEVAGLLKRQKKDHEKKLPDPKPHR